MNFSVQELINTQDLADLAPALALLAAPTEFKSYGEDQWKFLLHAGQVRAFVIPNPSNPNELFGCLLRIEYGPHRAFGMMLVAKDLRGKGLAKKLITAAMEESLPPDSIHLLAVCGEMGLPLYQNMAFQRVGTVTKMAIQCAKLCITAYTGESVKVDQESHFLDFLKLDQKATGLDRRATLQAIYSYEYVKMITETKDQDLVAAAFVTQHPNTSLATVGPILGDERCVLSLLNGIHQLLSENVTELALIVSDHPTLVKTLVEVGFDIIFELGTMTWNGMALPGDRSLYLGLIHPTLG